MSLLNDQIGLEEKLRHFNLGSKSAVESCGNVNTSGERPAPKELSSLARKVGPSVPPKPFKKHLIPEIPQSSNIRKLCKPLYSQRLQFSETSINNVKQENIHISGQPLLQRKKLQIAYDDSTSKVTLDNPAVLEQQLEVLAHHKKQLEKKGLFRESLPNTPKLSTISLASGTDTIYANIQPTGHQKRHECAPKAKLEMDNLYSNVTAQRRYFETISKRQKESANPINLNSQLYSNVVYEKNGQSTTSQPPLSIATLSTEYCYNCEDDIPPPPSPVSSSYSELRRATDIFTNKQNCLQKSQTVESKPSVGNIANIPSQTYINMKYNQESSRYSSAQGSGQDCTDYYGLGGFSQSSSTYESIYEPINPRPPSQLSVRSNYLSYSPYISSLNNKSPEMGSGSILSNSSSLNLSTLGGIETSREDISIYSSSEANNGEHMLCNPKLESQVEGLNDLILHSISEGNDVDNYGTCFKCNERVLGENSGCTAMNQIYHIVCFTCSQCQINLQGKPFYAVEGQPYCEYDYLQTLEKCSVCMKPILERILRATGKPFHPQCFTCVMCGKSLDGIPFTVDATNQNYCIEDFHKKFAPRCCVCKEPIMPAPGEEETVRVVALDRSFHFECYKCEDCSLLLSSEAEGRGCYPLDDHVLCKSCNAKRVQLLTNRITTEL